MRGVGPILAFFAAMIAAHAVRAADPVAVIVIGKNADQTAQLQQTLEGALAEAGVEVMAPSRVAANIASAQRDEAWEPKTNPGVMSTLNRNLKDAREAYYNAELGRVREVLGQASNTIAGAEEERQNLGYAYPAVSGEVLRDFHMLQLAMYLDDGKNEEARREALEVLHYDIAAFADPHSFRPEINAFLQGVRKDVGSTSMELKIQPAGGTAELHGRAVDTSLLVTPGEHLVTARAVGYRGVTRTIDAQGASVAESIRLPYYLSGDLVAALRAIIKGRGTSTYPVYVTIFDARAPKAVVLADANSDRVAVLKPRENMIVLSGSTEKDTESDERPGRPAVADWTVRTVKDALSSRGPFLGLRVVRPGWHFAVGASAGYVVRQQTLFGPDAPVIEGLQSSGPSWAVGGSVRRLVGDRGYLAADLEVSLRSPGQGGGTVHDPFLPVDTDVDGGYTGSVRPAIGYERRLAQGRLGLVGQVLAVGEAYRNPSDDHGFFPSFNRIGAGARLAATYDLSPSLRLEAGLEAIPFQYGREKALGPTLGSSVRRLLELGEWGGLVWAVPHEFEVGLRLTRAELRVWYAGTGTSDIDPSLTNATRSDVDWDTTLVVRRRF